MRFHQILFTALASCLMLPTVARADENGVSYWLPGQYGSFAATPGTPGWAWATLYYHGSVGAGGGQNSRAAARSMSVWTGGLTSSSSDRATRSRHRSSGAPN